jgi:hypothetical protein
MSSRQPEPPPVYNITQLAKRMSVGRGYVHAMILAGFKFTHGKYTTLQSAMDWRQANPTFRVRQYYSLKPKPSAAPDADAGGRCDEPLLTHG